MGYLTWQSLDGVVHAVLEETWDGFPPPHALIVACMAEVTWVSGRSASFGHVMSSEIRDANRHDTVSCVLCLAYCSRS